ncbi:hypothetical protein CYMTET_51928 [Cymbomonas tetramitiformis]|uniref:Uncharacterized protein n=1 Tax=Cymbomonas tetramitiformis TaxID=36881 RepID=A0AAE0ERB1_9CHLO|nr:hypothetical protein CYMTET_51928 [Cymbomonas tetramitiformis]
MDPSYSTSKSNEHSEQKQRTCDIHNVELQFPQVWTFTMAVHCSSAIFRTQGHKSPHRKSIISPYRMPRSTASPRRGGVLPAIPRSSTPDFVELISEASQPPFLFPSPAIADEVVFETDFGSVKGKAQYLQELQKWEKLQLELLPDLTTEILRIATVAPGEVSVQWEMTWTPSNLQWLVDLGTLWPGVEIEKYGILDRLYEESRFSWRGLVKLFVFAAQTGRLRIPIATMRGVTSLTFAPAPDVPPDSKPYPWLLISCRENLEMLSEYRAQRVKNRRITKDAMLFLDTRKPVGLELLEWDDRVRDELCVRSVPGMGQFDIQGMDASARDDMYDDAILVLAFGVICILVIGGGIGWVYYLQLQQERYFVDMYDSRDLPLGWIVRR